MKRKTVFTAILALICLFALALSGCTSFTGIRTAFYKAGYERSEEIESYHGQIVSAIGENYEEVCAVHVFTKRTDSILDLSEIGSVAVILEFYSTDVMNDCIARSDTLKTIVGEGSVPNSERVCGNCMLFFASGETVEHIFKNTK